VGGTGTTLNWSGSVWSGVFAGVTTNLTNLQGIWGSSANDVWAVGGNVILHWPAPP
jgi:hypothetical protein